MSLRQRQSSQYRNNVAGGDSKTLVIEKPPTHDETTFDRGLGTPTDWDASKAQNPDDRTEFVTHSGIHAQEIRDGYFDLNDLLGRGAAFLAAVDVFKDRLGITATELAMALQPFAFSEEDWERYFSNSGDMTRPAA